MIVEKIGVTASHQLENFAASAHNYKERRKGAKKRDSLDYVSYTTI